MRPSGSTRARGWPFPSWRARSASLDLGAQGQFVPKHDSVLQLMVRYADVFGDGLASNGKLREGFALTARMELALISNAMNADVAGERTASAANELTKRRESMRKGENMSTNIIRAWKDVEYRKTLTPEQLAGLPANPVEL